MPEYREVKFNQLSKADIIFTTSDAAESIAIRKATNSIISHAILVTEHNKAIEAIAPLVREDTWEVVLDHAKATVAIVMRRKGLINGSDQDKVVAAARKFKGLPYDYYGAAGSGMFGSKRNQIAATLGCSIIPVAAIGCVYASNQIDENAKDENADKSFFCSELVSRAFSIAGFPIVDGKATNAVPNAVYSSNWLEYVGNLYTPPIPGITFTDEQKERMRKSGYRKDY